MKFTIVSETVTVPAREIESGWTVAPMGELVCWPPSNEMIDMLESDLISGMKMDDIDDDDNVSDQDQDQVRANINNVYLITAHYYNKAKNGKPIDHEFIENCYNRLSGDAAYLIKNTFIQPDIPLREECQKFKDYYDKVYDSWANNRK